MTREELVDRLASHRTIGSAPRDELAWIAAHGTLRHLKPGEVVSKLTEVVDGLHIVLSGRMSIHVDRGAGRRKEMEWRAGDVTGLLPYSRMLTPPGDTIVDEAAEVVTVHRDDLPGLIRHCHKVTAGLVHVMTDRARRFTSTDLRDEKLISLGKLAAGLAHGLNNPASAAMRAAKSMASALSTVEEAARALGAAGLTEAQRAELDAVRNACVATAGDRSLSTIALADREDAIARWLESHDADTRAAEALAQTAVTGETLDRLATVLQGPALDAALRWIAGGCAARSLVSDVERATTRIHTLVAAVKGFTHMDRALEPELIDIRRGLGDTIALLEGKAREKSVVMTLAVAADLPPIKGLIGEINQVWENLVDNAIYAAPVSGHVEVNAAHNNNGVIVRVIDDGPGIPPDILEKIFDPFFTTKPIGEGSGLGLDIVRRVVKWHHGEIDVDSHPGRTEFRVIFPPAGAG